MMTNEQDFLFHNLNIMKQKIGIRYVIYFPFNVLWFYDFQVYLSKCMINNIEVSLNLKCFLDDQLFLFL